MQKVRRIILIAVAIVSCVGLNAGNSNSASLSVPGGRDEPGPSSSTGSGTGGKTEELNAGMADSCTDQRRLGACLSTKKSFTVERVDSRGTTGTGTYGATGTGAGGTMDRDASGIKNRGPGGTTDGSGGNNGGNGVTGVGE